MTDTEKAKAYEMALEAARKELGVDRKEWEVVQRVLHNIFPELAESEDERMLREFNDYLCEEIECRTYDIRDEKDLRTLNMLYYVKKNVGTWLEKQKEPHYTKRNALFDKCLENCDPEVMKEVSDKVDEMLGKEQKPVTKFKVGDKVHFKGDDVNILTITGLREDAYRTDSAYGPILFSDQDEWEIVEQKPVQNETEREYVRTIKSIMADFIRDKKPDDVGYYQQIYDWLDGRHIEQKQPLSERFRPDFPDVADFIDSVDDMEKNRAIGILEDYLKWAVSSEEECRYTWKELAGAIQLGIDAMKEQKQEWSEEDKIMIKCCQRALEYYRNHATRGNAVPLPAQFNIDGFLTTPEIVQNWLKSLRPQMNPIVAVDAGQLLKILPKRQEWSKEEEMYLLQAIETLEHENYPILANKLRYLCPSWKPSEWNREDRNRHTYLCDLLRETWDKVDKGSCIDDAISWLEELPTRVSLSSWKPSEEQMKALQNAVALTACDKELARLYNQLKKL